MIEEYFNETKKYFDQNPEYIYLILGVICFIMFIGIILDKEWAIDPASSSDKFNYMLFGHNMYRIVTGILFLLGAISSFVLFIYYKYNFIN